ncbi:MAG: sulfurtransferase [Chloroflexota bacterium]|nr:sulfurtransferase [Chloroflexota bacterium]
MALISADRLAGRIGDEGLRVVDVRWYLNRPGAGQAAYEAGHIPGAIFLDLDEDLSDVHGFGAPGRHPLPHPSDFRRRLEAVSIGSDHFVVAYDDNAGASAVRLWWMLDNLRHRGGVAVLDGGLDAWKAAQQPLSADVPSYAPARLELDRRWRRVIDRERLNERLGEVRLLDARAPERYRGEFEPIDPAAGHIPTAVNAPFTGNLGPDGRFLAPAELRRRFAGLGADDGAVVTYCGSGTNACHNGLAMRLAGLDDPILYVGSFSDWSRSGMPIATGVEGDD